MDTLTASSHNAPKSQIGYFNRMRNQYPKNLNLIPQLPRHLQILLKRKSTFIFDLKILISFEPQEVATPKSRIA